MTQPPESGHQPPWGPPPQYGQQPYGQSPQWGYPTPPPQWGRPTSTLAIVALVMTFVFFPAGFVLGLVALSQIKKTGEDGRGLAIAAIAVSSTFAVLFAGFIAFFIYLGVTGAFDDNEAIGTVSEVGSTEVGTCLRVEGAATSRVVDCSSEHDQEVSFVVPLAGTSYPGREPISARGNSTCRSSFEAYVGTSYDDSYLEYAFYAPSRDEWDRGEHRVICVIVPGDEDPFVDSERGSGD